MNGDARPKWANIIFSSKFELKPRISLGHLKFWPKLKTRPNRQFKGQRELFGRDKFDQKWSILIFAREINFQFDQRSNFDLNRSRKGGKLIKFDQIKFRLNLT